MSAPRGFDGNQILLSMVNMHDAIASVCKGKTNLILSKGDCKRWLVHNIMDKASTSITIHNSRRITILCCAWFNFPRRLLVDHEPFIRDLFAKEVILSMICNNDFPVSFWVSAL